MAERAGALLVFMEGGSGSAGRSSPGQKSPFPTLVDVLGLDSSDLGAVHYRGMPLFATDEDRKLTVDGVDGFLTIVSLRTMIHERFPALPVVARSGEDLLCTESAAALGLTSSPLFVGVSTTFAFGAEEVRTMCARVHRLFPESPIVLGGAGVTLNADWVEGTEASFAVLGDAEAAFPMLLDVLVSGQGSPEAIPNLAIRDEAGRWTHTERRQFAIDTITTPRWDLANDGNWPEIVWYESQRGCPFKCTFCSYPNQALGWILKSPERMADEFQFYAESGVETINCFDSTMVTPPKRMVEFCRQVLDRGIRVRWNCYAHAGNLKSAEMTRAMFAAGCRSVSIGLESCDDEVLRRMKKHVSSAGINRAIANCVDAGLMCAVNVIVGFPGETMETYRNTVESLVKLEPDAIGIQAFQVRDRTIPILEMDNFNLEVDEGDRPTWRHDGMDSREAARLALEALWEIGVRADRTVISPVGTAAGARLAPIDDDAASRFRRDRINPVINGYGRFLCFDPRFQLMDSMFGRPSSIPERSIAEAARQRDRTLRLWEQVRESSAAA